MKKYKMFQTTNQNDVWMMFIKQQPINDISPGGRFAAPARPTLGKANHSGISSPASKSLAKPRNATIRPGWTGWTAAGDHQNMMTAIMEQLLKMAIEIVDLPIKNGDFP